MSTNTCTDKGVAVDVRSGLVILVDTREQRPYSAEELGAEVPVQIGTLKAGDYSIVGAETRVGIERKTLSDYLGSITHGRPRFKIELAKLAQYDFAVVIVEANLGDIEDPGLRSRAHPNSLFGTTVAITHDFVPVLWAGDRRRAARLTYRLLKRFYEKRILSSGPEAA